jgi:hypothetical protein
MYVGISPFRAQGAVKPGRFNPDKFTGRGILLSEGQETPLEDKTLLLTVPRLNLVR